MFNSRRIEELEMLLLESYSRLSDRVVVLEVDMAERNAEKIAGMFPVSPAKKRGRPAKRIVTQDNIGEFIAEMKSQVNGKRKYVKSGKYAKVTTKKK